MKPCNTTTHAVLSAREYNIASNTAIQEGAVVALTNGLVVLAAAGIATAILGIAAERHSGTAEYANPRANGTKITVYDSPDMIIRQSAPTFTAIGGSTTTAVMAWRDGANDELIGSYIKLISKDALSANTDALGTIYRVTDSVYDNNGLTLTIEDLGGGAAGGNITARDVFALSFGEGNAVLGFLDTTRERVILDDDATSTGTLPFRCISQDLEREEIFFIPTSTVLGGVVD